MTAFMDDTQSQLVFLSFAIIRAIVIGYPLLYSMNAKAQKLRVILGAIQIKRDTLGGGGAKVSREFFTVLNSNFKAFGSKKSCLREQN